MKAIDSTLLLATLLVSLSLASGTRPEPEYLSDLLAANPKELSEGNGNSGNNAGVGGFFGPGNGFGVPGVGNGIIGGGYGGGSGDPRGGRSIDSVIRPSVVCKEGGQCYNKTLTCPAKCFASSSSSGKGYGGGGGGGGCNLDCKKCVAYC